MGRGCDNHEKIKIALVCQDGGWREELCREIIQLSSLDKIELSVVALADKSSTARKHANLTLCNVPRCANLDWGSPNLSRVIAGSALVHIENPFDPFGEAAFAVAKNMGIPCLIDCSGEPGSGLGWKWGMAQLANCITCATEEQIENLKRFTVVPVEQIDLAGINAGRVAERLLQVYAKFIPTLAPEAVCE